MDSLLIEIGTEEIPAGYIAPALRALSTQLLSRMDEARIAHGEARTYGTPRRLAVWVATVAPKQTAVSTEIVGPPVKVAYDDAGRPTLAALKFAEKVGVKVGALAVRQTERGDYLVARKTERGRATRTLMQQILPDVILATPFPKTMRWAALKIAFARPIHRIVALLGDRVIPFKVGDVKSGRTTVGHFVMQPQKIVLSDPDQYTASLLQARVIVDIARRRDQVRQEVEAAAQAAGGRILPDSDLLDIVTNLVEWPVATAGRFDADFLSLPRQILITAMREHQKYLAVVDPDGELLPAFVAVNNTQARDLSLVASGHERVLRARLKDAQFFFNGDLAVSAEVRLEKLKGVLFQAELGSMYAKTQRVSALATRIAAELGVGQDKMGAFQRAARLCKTDLVSQVVYEFPNLQGVMGRVYAAASGEPAEVAAAIEEHYRPVHAGAALPETETGAVLAIADKLDSICGCFCVGLVPTGAADPYALRRQAIGIVQIMLRRQMALSLRALIQEAVAQYDAVRRLPAEEVIDQVARFLQQRMDYLLSEEGYSREVVAAVLSSSADGVPDVWKRVAALAELKTMPDFEPIAVAFKRVVNIIRKADPTEGLQVAPERFAADCEKALHDALAAIVIRVDQHFADGDYAAALRETAFLRAPVDAFFDGVLVMDEDFRLRANRLALLREVAALFDRFADFSRLSV
jgi:glycyl-tRNA synthetase beta chain